MTRSLDKPNASSMHLVLVTGMAGAGKSIALSGLEDAGYFCVDNLPPELLAELLTLQRQQGTERIAIAIDARSVRSLPLLPDILQTLAAHAVQVQEIFLDASDEVLVRRFSETRRRHPLSGSHLDTGDMSVAQAIRAERALLQPLLDRPDLTLIDTSLLRSAQLLTQIKQLVAAQSASLTVVLQSFAFKRGLPLDANFVFDLRMLPNPFYEPSLRSLTGCDAAVAQFLDEQSAVQAMREQVLHFLQHWLPPMAQEHRSYVNISIGCTGGQHRSVYMVERLHQALSPHWTVIKRHRELSL